MKKRPSKVVTLRFYIMTIIMLHLSIRKIKSAKNIPYMSLPVNPIDP
jgi:hypothetical protein